MSAASRPSPGTPLTLRPDELYEASLERMIEAEHLLKAGHWLLATYVSGLAVESLLQAFALRHGSGHDARHDLHRWLDRCPDALVGAILQRRREYWNDLNMIWMNRLRYMSKLGLRAYLRARELDRGIKGGDEAVRKVNARRCVEAAREVHGLGVVLWSKG